MCYFTKETSFYDFIYFSCTDCDGDNIGPACNEIDAYLNGDNSVLLYCDAGIDDTKGADLMDPSIEGAVHHSTLLNGPTTIGTTIVHPLTAKLHVKSLDPLPHEYLLEHFEYAYLENNSQLQVICEIHGEVM